MKILYFAWLREKIGAAEETVSPPAGIATLGELMGWLAQLSPRHAAAFAETRGIRGAIDQEFARSDSPLGDAAEIAFFPPFTGG
ncbi:MAG TPA: molybdopterin converting factor subunit 1 [Acetobacteraceae bacterium]|nr:molybdopterin converting factor subunit 1 [Acetobacteraceae bacterium]